MRIIIAGAGGVGFHLAKLMAMEGHDIIVIDLDSDRLKNISNLLDVDVMQGSSTSISTLMNAGVNKVDLIVAVTSSEDANLTTCIIAKHLGAKKTVARIANVELLLSHEKLNLREIGIDELISPASLAAREIKRLCKESALTDFIDFDKGKLSLLGIKVEPGSKIAAKTIKETLSINEGLDFIPVAILRNNDTFIPRSDTRFLVNDHVYFVAQTPGLEQIYALFNKERIEIKNVMILGGSAVGYHAAKAISKKYRVKLVEPDKKRCLELADQLPDTLIIHADGRNVDILEDENLSEMDVFIAVTDNSETNIITSLVAKNHGVRKTIALVENIDFINLSQSIGVDTLINKKLIAADFIFRYVREGEVLTLTSLHGADVEVVEFEVKEKSKLIGKLLSESKFPENSIVGGIIRNEQGFIPDLNFRFQEKDHVVILAKVSCIRKIERIFHKK